VGQSYVHIGLVFSWRGIITEGRTSSQHTVKLGDTPIPPYLQLTYSTYQSLASWEWPPSQSVSYLRGTISHLRRTNEPRVRLGLWKRMVTLWPCLAFLMKSLRDLSRALSEDRTAAFSVSLATIVVK